MNKKNIKGGFTLVELLIVIAIIALLTGILLTNLTGSRSKARDAKRISDLGQLQLALELYYDRCKQYPATLAIAANNGCPTSGSITVNLGTYISDIPSAPSQGSGYSYGVNGAYSDYVLHTELENYNEVIKDGRSPGVYSQTCDSGVNSDGTNDTTDRHYCLGPK